MRKYRVEFDMDNYYRVLLLAQDPAWVKSDDVAVFQGSLADCEAYIRLCEDGYM